MQFSRTYATMAKDAKASSSTTKYHRMSRVDDGFTDSQFLKTPPPVPYKAILLASALFLGGTLLIVIGALLLSGLIIDSKYADRTWPVLILGSLMIIPGAYHVRIAYYAWRGYAGFKFEDIPEFN